MNRSHPGRTTFSVFRQGLAIASLGRVALELETLPENHNQKVMVFESATRRKEERQLYVSGMTNSSWAANDIFLIAGNRGYISKLVIS
jgi:hypothetical protein